VNSMLESSSVLHQYVLEEIRDSLTPHLGYAIELIYKMQDRNETFDYLAQDVPNCGLRIGSPVTQPPPAPTPGGSADCGLPDAASPSGQQQTAGPGGQSAQGRNKTIEAIMELSDAKKLAGLAMKVEFLLTRAKRQEQREAAMSAIPIGVQYGTLPPKDQARMNDAFVQLFRALGFDQPEDFFPLPDLNTPPPAPPPPKAVEAIALKGADLTPSQKDALAQQFGLPAATPQELQGSNGDQESPPSPPPPQSLPSNVIPNSVSESVTANEHQGPRVSGSGGGFDAPEDIGPEPGTPPLSA
jgi:hypothetical protein